MPLLLFVLSLVSTATPTARVAASWGVLVRSQHLRGSWTIALDDGTRLTGDWIVVNRDDYVTRDMGGGGGPAKAIYLIDSASARTCAFAADQPLYLYCTSGRSGNNTRIAAGATLVLPNGATALDTYQCDAANHCELRRGGTLDVDVTTVTPSLPVEEMLFEKTTGRSLATWLGGTARHVAGALVVTLPFRDETVLPGRSTRTFAKEIVAAEARIQIGPSPATVTIRATETARYIEDCSEVGDPRGCTYVPPICHRRPL